MAPRLSCLWISRRISPLNRGWLLGLIVAGLELVQVALLRDGEAGIVDGQFACREAPIDIIRLRAAVNHRTVVYRYNNFYSDDGLPSPLPANKPRDNISRLDLRVGLVSYVQEHPVFRKFYLIHVDIGSRIHRRSITCLGPHQERLELLNHKLVVLCNMKKNVKGLLSDCFVLYAKSVDTGEYLRPPAKARPGDRIFAPGYPFDPLQDWPFLPGGTELFKAATRKLRVSTKGIVKYNKTPLRTVHDGNITTYKACECKIRI